MKRCPNTNIPVQATCGDESSINGKRESPNNTLADITIALILNSINKNNFGDFPMSMPYGSPSKMRLYFVVMLLNLSDMEQDLHKNKSKYGV